MDPVKNNETLTDQVLGLLNALHASDPVATSDLVTHKVAVSDTIADGPDFICQSARGGKAYLSVLGLLNSILVKNGSAKLASIVDDNQKVVGFTKHFTPVKEAPAQTPKA